MLNNWKHASNLFDGAETIGQEELIKKTVAFACEDSFRLLRFMHCFTEWNGMFGPSVAMLAANIGFARDRFRVSSVIDGERGMLVASHIFDAARDEFRDRDASDGASHRCLAQRVVAKISEYFGLNNAWLSKDSKWLMHVQDAVKVGYSGSPYLTTVSSLFEAMGFHLASEYAAGEEFGIVDSVLTSRMPSLVAFLKKIDPPGTQSAYEWISIHSCFGKGVEDEHFQSALNALELANSLTLQEENDRRVVAGFKKFYAQRDHFYTCLLSDLKGEI